MNRIENIFNKLKKENIKALIPYVCCGYPNLEFTEKLVLRLAESGADLIELGVPYSDPVADGPTIQRAAVGALENGVTLEQILSMACRLRERTEIPLIVMTYFNTVYVKGIEQFIKMAAASGIDGLIIPDLPLEESEELKTMANKYGLDLILLIAPTSTPERIKKISEASRGFIYCVSVSGVTGARTNVLANLGEFLTTIRQETGLPLAVGFGISNPETARLAACEADGVIVGSALIEKIEESMGEEKSAEKALEAAGYFVLKLKKAITG
ncbi:MAG: tryptophan synthase subunit alpha [Bacillota bacterium]